jgi:hypothetical protein
MTFTSDDSVNILGSRNEDEPDAEEDERQRVRRWSACQIGDLDHAQQTKVSAVDPAVISRYGANWKRTLARNGLATPDMIEVTTEIVPRMACCPYAEVANGSSEGQGGVKLCYVDRAPREGEKKSGNSQT